MVKKHHPKSYRKQDGLGLGWDVKREPKVSIIISIRTHTRTKCMSFWESMNYYYTIPLYTPGDTDSRPKYQKHRHTMLCLLKHPKDPKNRKHDNILR
jgi:hypothetical protein